MYKMKVVRMEGALKTTLERPSSICIGLDCSVQSLGYFSRVIISGHHHRTAVGRRDNDGV
jgi:hypothetical protein